MYPKQKCNAAGVNGGVGRWISAVDLGLNEGLSKTEAK
jgi:hypothetical protein